MSGKKVLRADWRRTKKDSAHGQANNTQHKIIRLAFLMPDRSSLYIKSCNEIKNILAREREIIFSCEFFTAGDSTSTLLDRFVDVVLDDKNFDALITLGHAATHAARRRTQETKNRIPVIYLGTKRPISNNLIHSYHDSRNNLIGVTILPNDNILPIDCIPSIHHEKSTSFCIPYNSKITPHRLLNDIEEVHHAFKKLYGHTFTLVPYSEKLLPQNVFDAIHAHDAVILAEGSLSKKDFESFQEYCKNIEKTCYGSSASLQKNGLAYATHSDVEYAAQQMANIIKNVVTSSQHPSRVSDNQVISSSTFLYNATHSKPCGVSFSSHYVSALDVERTNSNDELLPPCIRSKQLFTAYCESKTLGHQEALLSLIKPLGKNAVINLEASQQRNTACKQHIRIAVLLPKDEPTSAEVFRLLQQETKKDRLLSCDITQIEIHPVDYKKMDVKVLHTITHTDKPYDVLLSIGKQASLCARRVSNTMKLTMPSIFTTIEESIVNDLLYDKDGKRNNATGVASNVPCQLLPLNLLKQVRPAAEKIAIIFREGGISRNMLENIQTCKRIMEKRGVSVEGLSFSGEDISYNRLAEKLDLYDAVTLPEGCTPSSDKKKILDLCKKKNIPTYATGYESLQHGAFFAEIFDPSVIVEKTINQIKAMTLLNKVASDVPVILIKRIRRVTCGKDAENIVSKSKIRSYEDIFDACNTNPSNYHDKSTKNHLLHKACSSAKTEKTAILWRNF